MRNWKPWLIFFSAAILSLSFIYLISRYLLLDFFTDMLWFRSLNYEEYYLKRISYRYMVFFGSFISFFLVFFINFWIASAYLGRYSRAEELKSKKAYKRFFIRLQSSSLKIYAPLSFIMALPFAMPFYEKWEDAVLCFTAPKSGFAEANSGIDISQYIFSIPFYSFLQNYFLISFLLLFLILLFLCLIEKRLLRIDERKFPGSGKAHLTLIFIIISALQTLGFAFQCSDFFYTERHMPGFYGPGFVELWMEIPLMGLTALSFLTTALILIIYLYKGKGGKAVLISASVFLFFLLIRSAGFLPDTFQKRISHESQEPFIKNSVNATLRAFGLDSVERLEYPMQPDSHFSSDIVNNFSNVPVWDSTVLKRIYTREQNISDIYSFPNIDIDRYEKDGVYRQVYIAAREVKPDSMSTINHMNIKQNRGYGIVMTPASQGGEEPITWFLRDIPVQSDYGFSITQPEIYYGTEHYPYALALNGEDKEKTGSYSGRGGVALASYFEKILFALYFKNKNIISETGPDSSIFFNRNIKDAVKKIAPYLFLDNDPYIVSTSKGLFWIQDAYTMSSRYPNSQPYNRCFRWKEFDDIEFNYIRNSVKIIIDAYNGDIHFYAADPGDIILQAYQGIYGEIFKPINEMPSELKSHIRYPQQLFSFQMSIYAKYHQTDLKKFRENKELWNFAKSSYGYIYPYYLTIIMPDMKKQEFVMVCPMTPAEENRRLSAFAFAKCDGDDYGKIIIYTFPKNRTVQSPLEISEKLIKHDIEIAHELGLMQRGNSEVILGRMLVLPADHSVFYVQPVYFRSDASSGIPELKRIIISQGKMAAMNKSLESAFEKLKEKVEEQEKRIQLRYSGSEKSDKSQPLPADAQ